MKEYCIPMMLTLCFAVALGSANARMSADAIHESSHNMISEKLKFIGYPVNQNIDDMDDFYHWYLQDKLTKIAMNNVGNPFRKSKFNLNTHSIERDVIDYFAKKFRFQEDDYWGFITASGTDGNNHGLYFARKHLQSKTSSSSSSTTSSSSPPIIYVSADAHYSVKKLADVHNTELRIIESDAMGKMDANDFLARLDTDRPAIVVLAIGTTFKGAVDDYASIVGTMKAHNVTNYYVHLDAALFGGYLPFLSERGDRIIDHERYPFDSISVSGHKFFGLDEPLGIFVMAKEKYQTIKPFHVEYLEEAIPTISCSRSAIGPMKIWWRLFLSSASDFHAQANEMMENAAYLEQEMISNGFKAYRNQYSNTVFFKSPPRQIVEKYSLAMEKDVELGALSHIVVMQHVNKKVIDQFVDDVNAAYGSVPKSRT